MYKYSQTSLDRLHTCHPDLQLIFKEAIKYEDVTIISGVRTLEEQQLLVMEGKSKTMNSKHLKQSDGYSHAVDASPYPINWEDQGKFYMFVGRVKQIADQLLEQGKITHKIRCGADWDMDGATDDQKFHDLPHVELIKP